MGVRFLCYHKDYICCLDTRMLIACTATTLSRNVGTQAWSRYRLDGAAFDDC